MDAPAGSGEAVDAVTIFWCLRTVASVAQCGSSIATKDAAGKTRSLDEITKRSLRRISGACLMPLVRAEGKQKKPRSRFGELQEELGRSCFRL